MKALPKRIAWIDVARGIGIILVVYGHVLRGIHNAHILPETNPIWASDYVVYTFHMPLFFILAGLQVDRSLLKGRWPFLKSKIVTVAYPYLLWSWFQLSLKLLAPKASMNAVHPASTLITILWAPVEQFWFLFFLFLCHLVSAATGGSRKLLVPILACAIAGSGMVAAGHLPSYSLLGTLCPSLVFYTLGILLSRNLLGWQPRRGSSLLWTFGSLLVLLALAPLCRNLSHGIPYLVFSWPATAAGVVLMVSLSHVFVNSTERLAKWAGELGRASMTIYIFHVIVSGEARILLVKLRIFAWSPQLLIGTLVGIAIPLLLHEFLQHYDLLAALGLGSRRRLPQPQPAPLPFSPGLE